MRGSSGQSTVEFAIVLFAFLCAFIALAAIWHAASEGPLQDLALGASSHSFGEGGLLGALADVLSF